MVAALSIGFFGVLIAYILFRLAGVAAILFLVIAALAGGFFYLRAQARQWHGFLDASRRSGIPVGLILNVKPHGQESEIRVQNMTNGGISTFRVWGGVRQGDYVISQDREVKAVATNFQKLCARVL